MQDSNVAVRLVGYPKAININRVGKIQFRSSILPRSFGDMAFKLLEKNKKDVAVLLKAECHGSPSDQLKDFFDYLLGTKNNLDQQEILDWCKAILAGDLTYTSFCDNVRSFNNSSVCGLVWNADYVAYRCRTCAKTPCMSLCSECFLAADHTNHDFNMFKSQAGGACDCGDESVMDSQGFCSKHCARCDDGIKKPPTDLLTVAEVMIPKLLINLIYVLGHQRSDKSDSTILEEVSGLIGFLQELSNLGTIMQNVLCDSICDELLYSSHFKNSSSDYFYEDKYQQALTSHACSYSISTDFPELAHLDKPLVHNSVVDELFFWIIKYQFSQGLVTFVLSLLPNEVYKLNFVRVFMKHYMYSMNSITMATEKSAVSNAIVHISVQLLSPMHLAVETVEKHNLLQIMVVCLKYIIRPSLMKIGSDKLFVVNCSQGGNLKEHYYWPIVTDVVNVLSHEPVIKHFLSDNALVTTWANIISYFQGMNVNKREKHHHLEFEPEGYYQAFSAELEICSTPLWTMLMHLNDPELQHLTLNVINIFQTVLDEWLEVADEVSPDMMSFHYPLHRYLALFISNAIHKQGLNSENLISSEKFLRRLLSHPLHLLACYGEINCNMWVRNGQQIKGQAMFYTHWNFASSTMDPDYFLIQVIASRLDPDEVMMMMMSEYHVMNILSFNSTVDRSTNPQSEHGWLLMESCLYFLATLLNIRVLSGDVKKLVQNELINLLCVADRTHSQLTSSIPDRCESHNPEWINAIEAALPEVSHFKPPISEIGATPQQGKYLPKAHVWIEKYNPLFVKMRTLYKKDFQASYDRFCEFVKQQNLYKGSATLWPPFRLPEPIHPSLEGLYKILHCSTMHGLIFSLLYKALNIKSIPEPIIYLTVHLLELVITLPHNAPARNADKCGEFKDQMFSSWYPGNDIFENALLVIPHITLNKPKDQTCEEKYLKRFYYLMKEGENSKAGNCTLSINESIITMLIKLYSKFSEEPYFYDGQILEERNSCIGDGKYFLKKILDKMCAKSDSCAIEVMKLCKVREGACVLLDTSQDGRSKAKLRQQRLLSDFASKQKKFMEDATIQIDSSNAELIEIKSLDEVPGKVYDCCICNMSAPSTSSHPICISARICPTSVLGWQKVKNSKNGLKYSCHMEQFNDLLDGEVKKVQDTWFKSPYLQTCGHYMHYDCYLSYIHSLHNQSQVLVENGEFFCPMCRQISNSVLPLIEANSPPCQFSSNYELSETEQIEKLLVINQNNERSSEESTQLNRAIEFAMDIFRMNSSHKNNDNFSFSASLLRNNLELNLSKICSKKKFSVKSASRKSCIYHLYVILSNSSKNSCPDYLALLWDFITNNSGIRNFQTFFDAPLLLKDICDIFVQYLLALPFNIEEKYFFTLVRILYNVKLVQFLIHVVWSLNPHDILTWRENNLNNGLENAIKIIIDTISNATLTFPTHEDVDQLKTFDLESSMMECLLPYLRISSMAHHYVYNYFNEATNLPNYYHGSTVSEFKELLSYLHLEGDNGAIGFVGLSMDESKCLVEKLCNGIEYLSCSSSVKIKDLAIFHAFKWEIPSLINLPEEFDTLFQFYRKECCEDCHKIPKYPSLCLICGKLICYNDNCCSKKELPEHVWHSEECGNKTGLYIGIDSSLILIVQSHRMAFWGSLYLDKHGEEDKNLRRGKPLYLNKERYNLLNHMWLTHSLDQLCKQWTFQGN